MGLIEKIEALIIPDDKLQKAITSEVYDEWDNRNKAINDVLDIIKAEFTEKDQPDSGGWWWSTALETMIYVYKEDNLLKGLTYTFLDGIGADLFEITFEKFEGKWVKAIMPNVKS